MPFCVNCGRPLAEGEVCNCQNDAVNVTAPVEPVAAQPVETPVEPVITQPVAPVVENTPVELPDYEIPAAAPVETPVNPMPVNPAPVTPVIETPDVQPTAATQSLALAKPNKKKNKTALIAVLGVIAIAAIAIVVLLFTTLFGGSKNPIDGLLKSINGKETDATVLIDKALPDFASEPVNAIIKIIVKTDEYEDLLEDFADSLEDTYDDLEDDYGKKWTLEFDAKESDLDKGELKDIAELYEDFYSDYLEDFADELSDMDDDDYEDIADNLDISEKDAKKLVTEFKALVTSFEKIKVSEGYELKGKFVLSSDEDEDKSDKYTINIIKLNGEWTIDYLSLLDELGLTIDYILYYYLGIY